MDLVGLISSAQNLLPAIPWKGDIGGCLTTLEFMHLLGIDWLSDTLVDMMMGHLACHA